MAFNKAKYNIGLRQFYFEIRDQGKTILETSESFSSLEYDLGTDYANGNLTYKEYTNYKAQFDELFELSKQNYNKQKEDKQEESTTQTTNETAADTSESSNQNNSNFQNVGEETLLDGKDLPSENPNKDAAANGEWTLQEPINPTDPIVHHDRSKALDHIVKINNESDKLNDGVLPKVDVGTDSQHINGIFFPLVNLNGLVIDKEYIQEMVIEVKEFAPKLFLTIYDEFGTIIGQNRPTMNNFISIIMIPPIDGIYKGISMRFYVKSFDMIGDHLYSYTCEYHWMELYNQSTRAITFKGCSSKFCQRSENKKPSTWEYLHEIALENGLGFSSTDDCRHHDDFLPRLVQGKTLVDFIDEHIEFGGMDADHIFDVFIDEYGYLTMINLPWVMNYELTVNNLAINKITSPPMSTKKLPNPQSKYVHRTITNWNSNTEYSGDLFIDWYETINNNSATFLEGTHVQMFGYRPAGSECQSVNGTSEDNALCQQDLQIQENSIVGQELSEYNTSTKVIVKSEFNAYQTELQKIIRDNYLKKLKTKILKVRMHDMNFGLHRGILVNVSIFTDNPALKDIFTRSYSNVDGNDFMLPDKNTIGTEKNDVIMKSQLMAPDPWMSGIYYIVGVEYIYDPYGTGSSDAGYKDYLNNTLRHADDKLLQYLYLIRKTDSNSPKGWKRSIKVNFDDITENI